MQHDREISIRSIWKINIINLFFYWYENNMMRIAQLQLLLSLTVSSNYYWITCTPLDPLFIRGALFYFHIPFGIVIQPTLILFQLHDVDRSDFNYIGHFCNWFCSGKCYFLNKFFANKAWISFWRAGNRFYFRSCGNNKWNWWNWSHCSYQEDGPKTE